MCCTRARVSHLLAAAYVLSLKPVFHIVFLPRPAVLLLRCQSSTKSSLWVYVQASDICGFSCRNSMQQSHVSVTPYIFCGIFGSSSQRCCFLHHLFSPQRLSFQAKCVEQCTHCIVCIVCYYYLCWIVRLSGLATLTTAPTRLWENLIVVVASRGLLSFVVCCTWRQSMWQRVQ